MGAFKEEGIDPEPWARAQLELLALAREQPVHGRCDANAANQIMAGLEYPGGHYIAAAAWLIAELASRLGTLDEVLDAMVQEIAGGAADW
jgi:hypothetical protein